MALGASIWVRLNMALPFNSSTRYCQSMPPETPPSALAVSRGFLDPVLGL